VALVAPCAAACAQSASPVVLDRVVAVVNRQAILLSDLDADIELSAIDPSEIGKGTPTPQHALEELISRTLIQQQIRQEDLQSVSPSDAEVKARIEEIRTELPDCVRAHCSTDAGWKSFLAAHGLTERRVEVYIHNRQEILNFIEERFRQGIEITHAQIETYYRNTLLPQFPAGETPPPLDQVASRVQEILLQQQVNALFDTWLDNLRSQGDVEILDPALETAQRKPSEGDGSE
jgi:peptidyl-prolyl cis-trans isomerase SurA